jgi:hypothetical protein
VVGKATGHADRVAIVNENVVKYSLDLVPSFILLQCLFSTFPPFFRLVSIQFPSWAKME